MPAPLQTPTSAGSFVVVESRRAAHEQERFASNGPGTNAPAAATPPMTRQSALFALDGAVSPTASRPIRFALAVGARADAIARLAELGMNRDK